MVDDRARTIATLRESVRSLWLLLDTEQRIASGSNPRLAERARADIPQIQTQITEGEARVFELEALLRPEDA
jgi:hypothetical protein